jgi:hypothetical protein
VSILIYIRFLSDEEWGGLGVSLASLAPRHTCVPVSGRIPLSLAVFVGWLFIAFSIVGGVYAPFIHWGPQSARRAV